MRSVSFAEEPKKRLGGEVGRGRFAPGIGLLFMGLSYMGAAWGYEYEISASEIRLLPPYCKQLAPDARKYMIRGPQPGLPHLHHFCHGLKFVIRTNRSLSDPKQEQFNIQKALAEFTYVTERIATSKGNPAYFAMARLERAKVLKRMGENGEAIKEFRKAIELKQNYIAAYRGISDIYRAIGDIKQAREVVEQGLKHAPNSKSLKRRLQELDKLAAPSQ